MAKDLVGTSIEIIRSVGRKAWQDHNSELLRACIHALRGRRQGGRAEKFAAELEALTHQVPAAAEPGAKRREPSVPRSRSGRDLHTEARILTKGELGRDAAFKPNVTSDIRRMVELAEDIAKVADSYYIGRTHWPENRLLQHRWESEYQYLAVLRWCSDRSDVKRLEIEMIQKFIDKKRNGNKKADSDGYFSGRWNCVYVTWTGSRLPACCRVEGVREIEHLDGRSVPPHHEERLDVFFTKLSPTEAGRTAEWPRGRTPRGAK